MIKYKLLKDLPTLKAGEICFRWRGGPLYYLDEKGQRQVLYSDEEICKYHILEKDNGFFEKVEEPDTFWFMNLWGDIFQEDKMSQDRKKYKEIGNYFLTEKEIKIAVEKLKAFTRLKEKGFRFNGWDRYNLDNKIHFKFEDYGIDDDYSSQILDDLNFLFGK